MPETKGRCLILGSRGFVGSAFVAEAGRRGYETIAVDQAEYEQAKGTECALLINANGNSKKYLAAQDPALEFDLSVRSVLRSLHDFRAQRYVHLSTVDVYPVHDRPEANSESACIDRQSLSPYGMHKFMAEELVRFYARSWLVFRMAGFVGRGLWKNSIHDLLAGKPLRVHPDSCYQYMNTRDMAAIVLDLAEAGIENDTFNVAGDGTITLREVEAMIPGRDPARLPVDLPLEHYEINIEKVKGRHAVPRTVDTVQSFVGAVLKGNEAIA